MMNVLCALDQASTVRFCMCMYVCISMYVYVYARIGMYLYVFDAFLHAYMLLVCICMYMMHFYTQVYLPQVIACMCIYVHVLNVLYVCHSMCMYVVCIVCNSMHQPRQALMPSQPA